MTVIYRHITTQQQMENKMKKIIIHDLSLGTMKTIKSGDNATWKKLSSLDKSMIVEVLKHGKVITCGKTIYELKIA